MKLIEKIRLILDLSDLKDYCGNLETVSEAYEEIYESSEDEGEL